MTDEERPDWLARHLNTLPEEIAPARDLWPGVADRLRRPPRVRPTTLALAATLVVSAGLALFGWQAYRAAAIERAATVAMIAGLLAPYEAIEADHAARWRTLGNTLDPAMLEVLEADRATLLQAQATLHRALAAAPADPTLHLLLKQVVAREADLLETGARMTGYAL